MLVPTCGTISDVPRGRILAPSATIASSKSYPHSFHPSAPSPPQTVLLRLADAGLQLPPSDVPPPLPPWQLLASIAAVCGIAPCHGPRPARHPPIVSLPVPPTPASA
eukprot:2791358-Rhodomonas_salina.1